MLGTASNKLPMNLNVGSKPLELSGPLSWKKTRFKINSTDTINYILASNETATAYNIQFKQTSINEAESLQFCLDKLCTGNIIKKNPV